MPERAERTIAELFLERVARMPGQPAFVVYPRDGAAPSGAPGATSAAPQAAPGAPPPRRVVTWGEWGARARGLAAVLGASGLGPGDRVAIFSDNRPLWPVAAMGTLLARGVVVGLFPGSAPGQLATLLRDAGARVAIVDTAARRAVVEDAWPARDGTSRLVLEEADVEAHVAAHVAAGAPSGTGAGSLAPASAPVPDAPSGAAEPACASLDDLAAVIYTSGSTGEPKGACLSHRYLAASAQAIAEVLGLSPDDSGVSFLPFAHAAEFVFGLATRIHAGMPAALVEEPAAVFAAAADFRPTLFGGLPRLYERLVEAANAAEAAGEDPRRAITARLGDRCRLLTSGGAALPVAVAGRLAALGFPVLGAYGQTEHLCISMQRPGAARCDTVGPPMPGTVVRIGDDGELLVRRGALTFSGYLGRPDATRAAFTEDGAWLHTGDVATLGDDGQLRITGRLKEVIALSTGRKVAPAPIEQALAASPLVAHAVCHGEGRKYLTALLALDPPSVEAWGRGHGAAAPASALAQHAGLQAELQRAVDAVNAGLARTDQVKRFAVTLHPFSVAGGELTPTFKPVRRVIAERFAASFDALYP